MQDTNRFKNPILPKPQPQSDQELRKCIKKTVCGLCLSFGRQSVTNPKLIQQVMSCLPKFPVINPDDNVCWECQARLRNALLFHKQARYAQAVLACNVAVRHMGTSNKVKSLSTLKQRDQIETIDIEPDVSMTNVKEETDTEIDIDESSVTATIEPLLFKCEDDDKDENKRQADSVNNETPMDLDEIIKCMRVGKNNSSTASTPSKVSEKSPILHKMLASTSTSVDPLILKHENNDEDNRTQADPKNNKTPTDSDKVNNCMKDRNNLSTLNVCTPSKETENSRLLHLLISKQLASTSKSYDEHCRREYDQAAPSGPRCDICDSVCSNEADLATHMEIFHRSIVRKRTPAECPICCKMFSSEYRRNSHLKWRHQEDIKHNKIDVSHMRMRMRRGYAQPTCQLCGKTFEYRNNLLRHMECVHEKRKYECPVCKKVYNCKFSMKTHVRLKHTKVDQTKETYYCKECDKFYVSKMSYKYHFKYSRSHGVTRFECDYCGKVFTEKACLVSHIGRVHLRLKHESCRVCGKSYYNRTSLRQHEQSKHGTRQPRKHMCSECGKVFSTNRTLACHQRTHSGVRPFACPHCDYRASQKCALVTHCKYKHKDKPPLKYQDIIPQEETTEK